MNLPSAGTPVLNAVTATKAAVVNVENIEQLTVHFICAGHVAGNGVLTLLGSNDGATFYGISFIDAASTTTTTAITSSTLNSNTSFLGIIPYPGFKYLKVNVAVTTDGSYTVWVTGNKH